MTRRNVNPRAPHFRALGWCIMATCLGVPALTWFAGCAPPDTDAPEEPPARSLEREVVYGVDDRQDVYAHPDAALQALTRASIVALVDPGNLDTSDPDNIQVVGPPLSLTQALCPDERFRDQPTGALCSGTLIDDDLVLTAGHCVESQRDCEGLRFVFNYLLEGEDEFATITSDDVYGCNALVVQELTNAPMDFAIVQLDRPVSAPHAPAPVHLVDEALEEEAPVTVIGFGSGLPAKIDTGGRVLDPRADTLDYFRATTDTFGGNSGSGIFNADNEVVGILVRGAPDYTFDGGCQVVNELDDDGDFWGGEDSTYVMRAVEALCATGWPSERLCEDNGGGEWCDACAGDDDCLGGWSCRGYADNPDDTYCAPPCGGPNDCRIDHACVGGFCQPALTNNVCSGNTVWAVDVCNNLAEREQTCSDGRVCSAGACVDGATDSDLALSPDDVQIMPETPVEGEPLTAFVVVRNIGDEAFVGEASVQFWRRNEDGTEELLDELPLGFGGTLEPGGSASAQTSLQGQPEGPLVLVARVVMNGDDPPGNNEVVIELEVTDLDTEGPVITSVTFIDAGDGDGIIEENEPFIIRWEATDPSGVERTTISVAGNVVFDAGGFELVVPGIPAGVYPLEFQAFDGDTTPEPGPVRLEILEVVPEGMPSPPVVRISEPGEGAVVRDVVTIRGTVTDDDLVFYEVVATAPDGSVAPITEPTPEEVIDGELGRWEPDQDGAWSITVRASDAEGAEASASRTVVVDNTPPLVLGLSLDPVVLSTSLMGPATALALVLDETSGVAPDGVQISVRVDGGEFGPWMTMVEGGDGWTAPVTLDWAELGGLLVGVRVRVRDRAGHVVVSEVFESRVRDDVVVNQPPSLLPLPGVVLTEGGTDRSVNLLARVSDAETPVERLGIDLRPSAPQILATLLPSGVIEVTSVGGFTGIAQVVVVVTDEGGLTAQGALRVDVRPDLTPPAPNPAAWQNPPGVNPGGRSVAMAAVVGMDFNGVEYAFEELTGNPGGDSSGWQSSPEYTDLGLEPGVTYAYRVRMRDRSAAANVGGWSEVIEVTTPTCDVCPAGTTRCSGNEVQSCGRDAQGCAIWLEPSPCPAGQACEMGLCAPTCSDTCPAAGTRECSGARGYRICGDFDDDVCLEWGGAESCDVGDRCEGGACVFECRDTCAAEGARRCASEAAVQVCDDFNADGCLEWGTPEPFCASDEVCEAGACVSRCVEDELEPNSFDRALAVEPGSYSDLTVCPEEEDAYVLSLSPGELLRVTLFFDGQDGDVQLELDLNGAVVDSSNSSGDIEEVRFTATEPARLRWRVRVEGDRANRYEMEVATRVVVTNACAANARSCVDEAGYRICEDLNGDGFTEWGSRISCAPGQQCVGQGRCEGDVDAGSPDASPGFDTGAPEDTGVQDDALGFPNFASRSRGYESQGGTYDRGCQAAPGRGARPGGWWWGVVALLGVWLLRR